MLNFLRSSSTLPKVGNVARLLFSSAHTHHQVQNTAKANGGIRLHLNTSARSTARPILYGMNSYGKELDSKMYDLTKFGVNVVLIQVGLAIALVVGMIGVVGKIDAMQGTMVGMQIELHQMVVDKGKDSDSATGDGAVHTKAVMAVSNDKDNATGTQVPKDKDAVQSKTREG